MKKEKKDALPVVFAGIAIAAVVAIIVMLLMLLKVGPFADKKDSTDAGKPGEVTVGKKEHLSKNGITTFDTGYMRKDLDALTLTKLMGNGINLGNTMEAYGRGSYGTGAAVSSYETFWGQPVTTQEIISSMKEAGFDSLRVPIAWTNAMNFESGDYTISEDYLNRIEEIINYAINADMYVIINDHWDGSWWGMFGSASEETRQKAMDMYISMWTQIANRYKEYSDYLIFESANEELGDRLNDVDIAKDSGTLSQSECYEMTNKINQTFVDTIRSTGGNNESRFLLIAGYNTDIERTCDNRYKMPTDSKNDVNKLMVSVHFYTPWGYCGNSSLSRWGTKRNLGEQNTLLESLTKFTDAGYGVVIGEYAVALADDSSVKENTCDFFTNFLDNCDMYNYCPVLWDCSSLFIRTNLKFKDENVAKLYKERSYASQSSMTEEELIERAKKRMDETYAAAPASFDQDIKQLDTSTSIAWIMINSSDWNTMYSVGDVYDPESRTDGIITEDPDITGEGTYTVSLDFTKTSGGYANGMAFSALAIGNGELLYPGYVIDIKEVLVNGEKYELIGKPYTCSDDGKCTRVNLYNEWVPATPTGDGLRTADGDMTGASPILFNNADISHMETLSITFEYRPAN